jgi:hypothetical protein
MWKMFASGNHFAHSSPKSEVSVGEVWISASFTGKERALFIYDEIYTANQKMQS